PEDLEHVFDRFYRTRQSHDRGISGKGLGLAIARAIVDAHGGTIDLSSDGPGKGTTVTLRLPAFR
ncbi:MAG: sensor histidine kinase, partial [Chloroflexota bacterium]|nr:sensor histidine kinase [Chloroflexota bacterium]